MKIAIVSTSLNPKSKSEMLAKYMQLYLEKHELIFINLKDYPLPFCDGASCYEDSRVAHINDLLIPCECIFVASPIYNYDVSATCKNLIELSKKETWEKKRVGFMVSATGYSSYLSPLSIMNSLMVDFRSIVTPRYVYAAASHFEEDKLSKDLIDRLELLVDETL